MAENETTNAVLSEQIKSLIKITDERFGNLKDTLTRIEANSSHFVLKSELEEVKKDFNAAIQRIELGFVEHNKADVVSFGGLTKGQEKISNIIQRWIGALAFLACTLPFLAPVIMHYLFHF